MDDRTMQFRVGVMVVSSVIIVAILVLLFGELPTSVRSLLPGIQPTYTIYIFFDRAPGVAGDTPVRDSGILIGRVTSYELQKPGVLVTAAIGAEHELYKDEICRITRSMLGGDAALEFVLSGDETLPHELVKPGDHLTGIVGSDPFELIANLEGDMSEAIISIASTSNEVGQLARQVNDLIEGNEEQLTRIVSKAEQAIDGLRLAADNVNEIIGGPETKEKLRQAVGEIPEMLRDTREAMEGLRNTLALADENLRNLQGLTRPLAERGDELVESIGGSFNKLDQLLGEFNEFVRKLNSSDGTIAQLLNNPELYDNVNQAALNLERLTRDLRPIVKDARIVMDKVARHPEDLGIRGLIQRRSGIK